VCTLTIKDQQLHFGLCLVTQLLQLLLVQPQSATATLVLLFPRTSWVGKNYLLSSCSTGGMGSIQLPEADIKNTSWSTDVYEPSDVSYAADYC
jgi:hypothetical protein